MDSGKSTLDELREALAYAQQQLKGHEAVLKKNEELILENNNLRSILHRSSGIMSLSIDKQARLLDFNSSFYSYIKQTQDIDPSKGLRFMDCWPKSSQKPWLEESLRKALNGEEFTEVLMTTLNSYLEFEWIPLKETGAGVLIRNVTDQYSDRDKLNKLVESLSLSLSSSKAGTWDWEISTNSFYWSDEFKELFGMAKETEPGMESWGAMLHPDDRENAFSKIEEAIRQGIELENEYRIILPDGRIRWIRAVGRTQYDNGNPVRMTGLCIDSTERKEEMLKTMQLQRLYITLSQINQTIVRVKSAQELYESISKVTVEFGSMKLAWVGLLDEESGNIHPVAGCGEQWNPVLFSGINHKKKPYSNGIIAKALHDGIPTTCEDILEDKKMVHWRPIAEKYGFHSEAVVPFRFQDKIIGALFLFSDIPGFFKGPDEIGLLEEMGLDISFALDTIENDRIRQQWADAFNYCAHGIAIANPETNNILACNSAFAKLQGRDPEEMANMSGFEMYVVDERKKILEYLTESDKTGSKQFETRMIRKDGYEYPVQIDVVSVKNHEGKILYRVGTQQDISKRKLAEDRLRRNEKILSLFVKHAPAAIAMFDTDMRYIAVSRRYISDYRLESSQILGRSHYDIFPEIDQSIKDVHKRCLAGATEKDDETAFPRMDGTLDWVRWECLPWYEDSDTIGGILLFTEVITDQHNAMEVIRKSEERFRVTLDNMLEGCQIIGHDWIYLYINHAAEIHNRRPNEELLGYKYMDMWPGIENTEVFYLIRDTLENRKSHRLENKFIFPDGNIGWFDLSIQPVQEGVFILSMDITNKKLAEIELKHTIDRLNDTQQTARLGSWDCDMTTGKIWWSDELYRIHNVEPDHFTPTIENITEFIHPEDKPLFIKEMDISVKERTLSHFDLRILLPTGIQKYCNVISKHEFDNEGKHIRSSGSFMDINDRKTAESELLESEVKFRAFFENSMDALMITVPDGRILSANKAACTMLGYSEDELINGGRILVVDIHDPNLINFISLREKTGKASGEITMIRKNGERFTAEISSTVFHDKEGNQKTSMIIRDITERKMMEEAILKINEKLEKMVDERTLELTNANRELEAFSYSVSHDLRAPLRAIDGFTRMLAEDYNDRLDDEGRRFCSIIRDSTKRMGQLIDDLLLFSRLSRADINKSLIDMGDMASSVFNELVDKTSQARIEFSCFNVLPVHGDANLIHQVWVNLISNAIKYSSKKPEAKISIHSEMLRDKIVYSIKDNGAGFNVEYSNKLFGVFQRLHSVNDFEGTGVGLASVKRIIVRHGGDVWAESEEGKGATFFFSLPVK